MANTEQQQGGCVSQIIAVFILAALIGGLSTCFGGKSTPTVGVATISPEAGPTDEEIRQMGRKWAAEDEAWQPPKGFELTDEMRDLRGRPVRAAIRWLKPSQFDCEIADTCWGVEVIPVQYCKRIYAEIALLNAQGTNVGMTNDAATDVKAKTKARFVFETFEKSAHNGRISELICF